MPALTWLPVPAGTSGLGQGGSSLGEVGCLSSSLSRCQASSEGWLHAGLRVILPRHRSPQPMAPVQW